MTAFRNLRPPTRTVAYTRDRRLPLWLSEALLRARLGAVGRVPVLLLGKDQALVVLSRADFERLILEQASPRVPP